ncbi:hypothetical protein [Okeania sp. KiyG1]|uniref:hypothetical protein n=1 Tax=Okeania sp. KiyG1 TaxID=2720165 RepID=UPI0019237688|nr:hypothetical protein [Okeania sp. KiyG1]
MKSQEESGVVEDVQRKNYPKIILPLNLRQYSLFEPSVRQKPGTFSLPLKAKTFIDQDFYI